VAHASAVLGSALRYGECWIVGVNICPKLICSQQIWPFGVFELRAKCWWAKHLLSIFLWVTPQLASNLTLLRSKMKLDGLHIFSTPHVWQLTPTHLPFHPLISEFMIFSFFFRDVHLPLGVGFMIVNFVCYTRLHERRVHKSFFFMERDFHYLTGAAISLATRSSTNWGDIIITLREKTPICR
jgi:hypothetical protein